MASFSTNLIAAARSSRDRLSEVSVASLEVTPKVREKQGQARTRIWGFYVVLAMGSTAQCGRQSPNVPWTASRIRRSLSHHRPQHATAQAPVAERPLALPPVIRGAGRVDNLVWAGGGCGRLLRRGSRCSGAQQTYGRVERMTRTARAWRVVGPAACLHPIVNREKD